jgi:CXXX repeat peptide maturase
MAAEKPGFRNLIVMLDGQSASHCHYPAAGTETPMPMPATTARSVVAYAAANDLTLTLLYARDLPPAELDDCFAGVACARIVPLPLAARYPGALVVIDRNDWDSLAELPDSADRNIVLRLQRGEIPQLPLMIRRLLRKCRRLNLCLLDIEAMTDPDFESYRDRLAETAAILATEYRQGREFELSAITDRMLLTAMNNCDAGQQHLTVAPDGTLHLCPGFFRLRPQDAVGNLTTGPKIPNAELLRLDHAPICSICDAFQCRRCHLLNKQLTMEINTPSRQQCVLSHLERDASRKLLQTLADHEDLKKLAPIPELDYLDPFEELMARRAPKAPPVRPAAPAPSNVKVAKTPFSLATGPVVVKDGDRTFTLPRLEPLKVPAPAGAGAAPVPRPAPGQPAPTAQMPASNSRRPEPVNLDTASIKDLVSKMIEQQRAVLETLEKLEKELS